MESIKLLYSLSDLCLSSPITTIICRDFWVLITEIFMSICLFGAVILIKMLISHELEFLRKNNSVEHGKRVADPEALEKNWPRTHI